MRWGESAQHTHVFWKPLQGLALERRRRLSHTEILIRVHLVGQTKGHLSPFPSSSSSSSVHGRQSYRAKGKEDAPLKERQHVLIRDHISYAAGWNVLYKRKTLVNTFLQRSKTCTGNTRKQDRSMGNWDRKKEPFLSATGPAIRKRPGPRTTQSLICGFFLSSCFRFSLHGVHQARETGEEGGLVAPVDIWKPTDEADTISPPPPCPGFRLGAKQTA